MGVFSLVLIVGFLLSGCARSSQETLLVSAAASLQPVMEELAAEAGEEIGMPVVFNYGSTGKLAQQIEQGAPVDVFVAADISYIDELRQQDVLLPDFIETFARGRLVLLPRAGLTLTSIEDLARPDIKRIAIANPDHAPYGAAARQALETAGLWERVQSRLVFGENVAQSYQYVQTGNADVAILPLSLLDAGATGSVLLPAELYEPPAQTAAIVKTTRHPQSAARFLRALTGPTGQAILRRHGYTLTSKDATP